LRLEKERRGKHQCELIFVGARNVANHWWCTESAVLKSRDNELGFFAAYIADRVEAARAHGCFPTRIRRLSDWLDVGAGLTAPDIETVQTRKSVKPRPIGRRTFETAREMFEVDLEVRQHEDPSEMGPFERGDLAEGYLAEKYPRLRWSFPWENLVVVGIPDGLTGRFVYEFKSAAAEGAWRWSKGSACAQADLYAFFWKRPEKRVQHYSLDTRELDTIHEVADVTRAQSTLRSFSEVAAGGLPYWPKEWKCDRCEFRGAGCRRFVQLTTDRKGG
jgi:hypothetical protein